MYWLLVAVQVLLESLVSFGFNALATLPGSASFPSGSFLSLLGSPSPSLSLDAPAPVLTLAAPMATVEPVMVPPADGAPSRASLPEGFPNPEYLHLLDARDLVFVEDDLDSFEFVSSSSWSSSSPPPPRSGPLFSAWARDLALLLAVIGIVAGDLLSRIRSSSPPPPRPSLRLESTVQTAASPLVPVCIRIHHETSSQTSPVPAPRPASASLPISDSTLPSLASSASVFTGSHAVASLDSSAFVTPPIRDPEARAAALVALLHANYVPKAASTFVPTSASDPFIDWWLWEEQVERALAGAEVDEGGEATLDASTRSSVDWSEDEVESEVGIGGDEVGGRAEVEGSLSMRLEDFGLAVSSSSGAKAPGSFFVPTSSDDPFVDWPRYDAERLPLLVDDSAATLASSSPSSSAASLARSASSSSLPSLVSDDDADLDSCSSSDAAPYPMSSTPDGLLRSPSASRSLPSDLVVVQSPASLGVERLLLAMQKESWARQEARRNDIFTIDEEDDEELLKL